MQRRDFLSLVGGSVAGAALARVAGAQGGEEPMRAERRRGGADFRAWTWVHGDDKVDAAAWRSRFARVRDSGITGVVVGGGTTPLHAEAAKAEGLAFHRWTWIANRTGDAWVKANHPEWFSVSRKGESSLTTPPYVGYYQWLCPSRPEVRAYLRQVVDGVAQESGVDGVHLDYIRHPDVILPRGLWAKYNLVQDHEMPEFDFCYCAHCRDEFRAQGGQDPMTMSDPASNMAWREYRWNSVTGLVRELSAAVRARGKQITAAVFPTPTLARALVRQAWEQWPLDAVFPMLYNGFYEEGISWIGASAREGVRALPASEPLYAGLYLPDLDPPSLGRAIASAREGGAAGVAFFEMNGLTDAHLAAVREALRR